MALDKTNKNYYYNVGRCVAVIEIMNGLGIGFRSSVFNNANDKLPYQLKTALANDSHNLHNELLEPAEVVLLEGELPKKIMDSEQGGSFWMGYYNEKSFVEEKYGGIFGKVTTERTEYTPSAVSAVEDNNIEELER